MVIASFQIENSYKKVCFFQKNFLVAITSIQIILVMLFLNFNKINANFAE